MTRPGFPHTRKLKQRRAGHGAGVWSLALAAAVLGAVLLAVMATLPRPFVTDAFAPSSGQGDEL